MAGWPPNYCGFGPFGARADRGDFADRVCRDVFGPVLFSDHHSGIRDLVPSSQGAAPRQLQVMEGLLSPFFGKSAPRIARTVRSEFGTLGRALSATDADFARLGRDGRELKALLLAARHLIDGARHERLVSSRLDPSDLELQAFLRSRLCIGTTEKLMVIFCDKDRHYLLDEEIGWGTDSLVELDVPALFRRALVLGASSFLIAHNHPSGNCVPSDQDIGATRHVAHAAQLLDLSVLDHLIVTTDECYSMRAGGLF